MKKLLVTMLIASLAAGTLAGCGSNAKPNDTEPAATDPAVTQEDGNEEDPAGEDDVQTGEERVLKVAALESAYGGGVWEQIATAFENEFPGVSVELTIEKNLEEILNPQIQAGEFPDVVHLAVGREAGLTETFIKEEELTNLDEVLAMTVPGESVTVGDKLVGGFTDTLVTNPYADGSTYLAPMFYSPCGMFYNAALFEEKGWEVPATWDEMWELGDKAADEGIALFTYPTAGYFDAFFFAVMNSVGGPDFFNSAMRYEEGIWESAEAKECFDIMAKLATYTESTTVANANDDNFQKNQQLILDNKALFMPNGTWVTGEMADAPRADGFEWGFTALPAAKTGGDRYSYTFFEQAWIPKQAPSPDLAKEFLAFLYSDTAVAIFAANETPAAQPVPGVADMMNDEEQKMFFSIYDNGAKAAMGSFAATESIEGLSMYEALFEAYNSVVAGTKTQEEWMDGVKSASDEFRAVMK